MGHDANIKSSKEERRLRFVFLLSLVTLALSVCAIISLLEKETANDLNSRPALKRYQAASATTMHLTEATAAQRLANIDEAVRSMKKTGIIMETSDEALKLTGMLQRATRDLIKLRYGEISDPSKNYRVKLELEFQSSIPGEIGIVFVIEMLKCNDIPIDVYQILRRRGKTGVF